MLSYKDKQLPTSLSHTAEEHRLAPPPFRGSPPLKLHHSQQHQQQVQHHAEWCCCSDSFRAVDQCWYSLDHGFCVVEACCCCAVDGCCCAVDDCYSVDGYCSVDGCCSGAVVNASCAVVDGCCSVDCSCSVYGCCSGAVVIGCCVVYGCRTVNVCCSVEGCCSDAVVNGCCCSVEGCCSGAVDGCGAPLGAATGESTVLKPKPFTCPAMPITGCLLGLMVYWETMPVISLSWPAQLLIHNSWLTLFGGLEWDCVCSCAATYVARLRVTKDRRRPQLQDWDQTRFRLLLPQ